MKPVILIVDDSETCRYLVSSILAEAGMDLLLAAGGYTALEIVADRRPDLVLLDLQMPGIDGFETVVRLRERPELGTVPILAFTTCSNDETREKCTRIGFNGLIAKPFDNEKLPSELQSYITASAA